MLAADDLKFEGENLKELLVLVSFRRISEAEFKRITSACLVQAEIQYRIQRNY